MKHFRARSWLVLVGILSAVGGLTGCAGGLFGGKDAGSVVVAPAERVYFRLSPFDAAATAELQRAGLDPAALQAELEAEMRYRLYARGQEEALDSTAASAVLEARVNHFQPGYGNSGPYAAFTLVVTRGDAAQGRAFRDLPRYDSTSWTWQGRAKDNPPPAYAVRHLARLASGQMLQGVQAPKKDPEPPPPLHLLR